MCPEKKRTETTRKAPKKGNSDKMLPPAETLWQMFRKMLEIRRFEEATIKGYQQRKIGGFLHTYIGSEAVGAGVMAHKEERDSVITTYRCHGLALALGMSMEAGMAELYGKVTGCARGKGGSMHFFSREHSFLGGHGIVGGQYGPGIGAAFAKNYRDDGGVSFIHFGDGAVPQGTFHENLNLAALWGLPAIFVCEDNQYGMGTANQRSNAVTDFAKHAKSYGMDGYTLNGMDLLEVWSRMKGIVRDVRKNRRPALVHMVTYRFMGHSVSDAGLYRSKEEVAEWKNQDPIAMVGSRIIEEGIHSKEEVKELDRKIKAQVKAAVAFAESSPQPPLEELGLHVFKEKLEASR